MYSFPMADVTNYNSVAYNDINVLSHSSGDQESDMGLTGVKPRFLQDRAPSGGCRRKSVV